MLNTLHNNYNMYYYIFQQKLLNMEEYGIIKLYIILIIVHWENLKIVLDI